MARTAPICRLRQDSRQKPITSSLAGPERGAKPMPTTWRMPMSTPGPRGAPTATEADVVPDEIGADVLADAEASPSTADDASLVRSSGIMAVGTIASRVTGFLRTAVLIYAIGTHDLGNAYNIANTLPNAVYNLMLGGITVVATAAAAPLADLYGQHLNNAATHRLTIIFAYFFIPQIFFYGVCSLAGAILNARGRFGAPMWTPVVNNVVVILVGLAFMAVAGLNQTPATISTGEIQLLGIGTTLGIVAQTAALVPSLRRVGFHWRPRFDFRRSEVGEIGRMGGWMFGYVVTTQISFLVTTVVANTAGSRVSQVDAGAGISAYSNAWQLFQLPYAIVGISVITAMLPRMSAHAAERRYGLVSGDFSTAARLASVIVVPAALVLAVLGPPLAVALFGYGSTSPADARYLGEVFAVFSLGLLPYMLFQLLLRVFYALHDSKTPAIIGFGAMLVNIGANLAALEILPARLVVAGLGAGFGLANLVGTVAAWLVLSRRIGGLDGLTIGSSLVRMHIAAIPAVIFAVAVTVMINAVISGGTIAAIIIVVLAGSGALLLYVMFAKAFQVDEVSDLTASLTTRSRH